MQINAFILIFTIFLNQKILKEGWGKYKFNEKSTFQEQYVLLSITHLIFLFTPISIDHKSHDKIMI